MSAGRIAGLIIQAFTKAYQYDLKVTAVWEEILGTLSFGSFILMNQENTKIIEDWLNLYEKAIKAYSYWLLLPAIAKVYGHEIEKYPSLWNFFSNFNDYYLIHNRIKTEPEASGKDLEGIAEAFRNFFSPIVKGFMIFTGTFFSWARDITEAGAHALINFMKSQKYDVRNFIEQIIQEYRDYGMRMRTVNIPPEFYYQQRVTLDFDIVVLFAHVNALMTYKEILQKKKEQLESKEMIKDAYAYLIVDKEIIMNIKIDEQGRITFCLSKQMIELLRGEDAHIELGGAEKESLL